MNDHAPTGGAGRGVVVWFGRSRGGSGPGGGQGLTVTVVRQEVPCGWLLSTRMAW